MIVGRNRGVLDGEDTGYGPTTGAMGQGEGHPRFGHSYEGGEQKSSINVLGREGGRWPVVERVGVHFGWEGRTAD